VDLGFVLLGNWERRCVVFPRKGTLNPKPYWERRCVVFPRKGTLNPKPYWERRCLVFPRKGTLNPKPYYASVSSLSFGFGK